MKLTELLSLKEWGRFEREVHDHFGVNVATFDPHSMRITDYICWANDVCRAVAADPEGSAEICARAQAEMAVRAARTGQPVIDACAGGMTGVVVPIFSHDEFLGTCHACGRFMAGKEVDCSTLAEAAGMEKDDVARLTKDASPLNPDEVEKLARFLASWIGGLADSAEVAEPDLGRHADSGRHD